MTKLFNEMINPKPHNNTINKVSIKMKILEKKDKNLTNSQFFLKEIIKKTGCSLTKLSISIGILRNSLSRLANSKSKNLNIPNFEKVLYLYLNLINKNNH